MKTVLDFLKAKCPRLCEGLSPSDGEKVIAKHMARRIKEMGGDMGASDAAGLGSLILQDVAQLQNTDGDALVKMLESAIDFVKKMLGIGTAPAGDPAPAPAAAPVQESKPPAPAPDPRVEDLQRQLRESRVRESARVLREACEKRKLPADSVKRVLEAHKGRDDIDEAAADGIAVKEQGYVDRLIEGAGLGRVSVVRESRDNAVDILSHMVAPQNIPEPKCGIENIGFSLHRFSEAFFGVDLRELGRGSDARRKLRESVDATNFDQVYADALRRALLANYKAFEFVEDARKLVRIVPMNDFRTQHVIKAGWYGYLPDVGKGAPYLSLTTPTDAEQTIALAKKGGTETWTWEDQLNDDIGLLQTINQRLAQAAAETFYNTVLAIVRDATQPTMVDSYALTSSSRSPANEGTAALTADATGKTNFINSIIGMMKATGGSGQRKGIRPKFCVIPFEKLEAFSYVTKELSGGVTGTDVPDAVARTLKLAIPEGIIDWGTTNTTDWYLVADPMQAEVIRAGFLGGRQDPELFIAEDDRFGSMFTRDSIDLKIRHVYAIAAVDTVGIYGNDAAT